MPKVVFLAKGTRGDVLPLLCIAITYQERHQGSVCVFVCAPSSIDAHVRAILQQRSDHKLEIWDLPEVDIHKQCATHSEEENDAQLSMQDQERLSLLKAEATVCLKASQGADLIVYNLFSLEGHFIASHLSIPCIAMSPHLQLRSVPAGFEVQLSESHPKLYQRLKKDTAGEEVGYAEVDHWMWRMFLDDYGSTCESLGLPTLPLSLDSTGALPPPTPLLYGISPLVIPRQPYWPDSVSVCGYWSLPPHFYPTPDSSVTALLHSLPTPPLYIGFGSMESYLLDMDWTQLFATLEKVLEKHALSGLFQSQRDGPVSQAYSRLSLKPTHTHLLTQVVPHSWLFPQCSVIFHHGGSGTVAAALRSGRPQVISPIMFDQNMWAERLSWMGVAYQCPSPGKLQVQDLSQALDYVMEKSVHVCTRVAELSGALLAEDGVKVAVDKIEKSLDRKL